MEVGNRAETRPVGLNLTFRFDLIALFNPRPYSNHCKWMNRLESLAIEQVLAITRMVEIEEENLDTSGAAPLAELCRGKYVLARDVFAHNIFGRTNESISGDQKAISRSNDKSTK